MGFGIWKMFCRSCKFYFRTASCASQFSFFLDAGFASNDSKCDPLYSCHDFPWRGSSIVYNSESSFLSNLRMKRKPIAARWEVGGQVSMGITGRDRRTRARLTDKGSLVQGAESSRELFLSRKPQVLLGGTVTYKSIFRRTRRRISRKQ